MLGCFSLEWMATYYMYCTFRHISFKVHCYADHLLADPFVHPVSDHLLLVHHLDGDLPARGPTSRLDSLGNAECTTSTVPGTPERSHPGLGTLPAGSSPTSPLSTLPHCRIDPSVPHVAVRGNDSLHSTAALRVHYCLFVLPLQHCRAARPRIYFAILQ